MATTHAGRSHGQAAANSAAPRIRSCAGGGTLASSTTSYYAGGRVTPAFNETDAAALRSPHNCFCDEGIAPIRAGRRRRARSPSPPEEWSAGAAPDLSVGLGATQSLRRSPGYACRCSCPRMQLSFRCSPAFPSHRPRCSRSAGPMRQRLAVQTTPPVRARSIQPGKGSERSSWRLLDHESDRAGALAGRHESEDAPFVVELRVAAGPGG